MVDKSEKFRWLIRLGFAARGVVYSLIGYLFLVEEGKSGDGGPGAAFAWIQDTTGGIIVLYLCALGLLGYAGYRLCSPLFDIENYGSDKMGWAHRAGHAASGLGHLVLAYTAFQFAQGTKQSSGDTTQEAATTVLSVDFGAIALGLVGLGFLAAVYAQAKKAWTGDFMNRISARAPTFVEPLGRVGFAARSVVFLVIGWSLIKAAWFSSGSQAKSVGSAIDSLRENGVVFTLVALGILMFGIFSLFLARYRIVPDLDADGRIPKFRAKVA